jgi:H2-forming N5,N10-methylenetetrahydromethanopterin dehydrogenase-like enzyme
LIHQLKQQQAMTTAQKLNEIIEKGGFEAKVAATILNSGTLKCSWKQWEIIQSSHDDLDWTELNTVDATNIRHDHVAEAKEEAKRIASMRVHLEK